GGSLRVPAHFCGVFGHKPTWGLMPARGHALREMSAEMDIGAIGPLTRSAPDLAMALDLLAIPVPDDSRLSCPLPPGPAGLAGLRVALWAEDRDTPTDSETVTALHALADAMEKHGALVNRTARPGFNAGEAYHLYVRLLAAAISGFQGDE